MLREMGLLFANPIHGLTKLTALSPSGINANTSKANISVAIVLEQEGKQVYNLMPAARNWSPLKPTNTTGNKGGHFL